MSNSYNKLMGEIKKKKEGFTNKNKKKQKTIGQKRNKNGTQNKKLKDKIAWGYFTAKTVQHIIYFWIFFPFWSYQLQIIIDQADCEVSGKNKNCISGDARSGCALPYIMNPYQTPRPYAPELTSRAHVKPINIIRVIENEFKKIAFFIVGWIKDILYGLAKLLSGKGSSDNQQGGSTAQVKQAVEAVVALEAKTATTGAGASSTATRAAATATRAAASTATGQCMASSTVGTSLPDGYGGKISLDSFNYPAWDVLENGLTKLFRIDLPLHDKKKARAWASELAKYKSKAACCVDMRGYLDPHHKRDCSQDKSQNESKQETFIAKFFNLKNFGWPYTNIFDKDKSMPTAYNPDGSVEVNGWSSWIGAWFAETQLKAWSRNRWILHIFLYLFYPWVHRPLTRDMIDKHFNNILIDIAKFLKQIDEFLHSKDRKPAEKVIEKYTNIQAGLVKYQAILQETRGTFRSNCREGCNIKEVLLGTLKHYIIKESNAISTFEKSKKKAAKGNVPSSFFLDFFISAIRPTSMRQYEGYQVFWKWCEPFIFSSDGSGLFYWGRYFITLLMPILTSLQFYGSIYLSIIQTIIGYFNRYSIFWLPILFFMFPIPLIINVIGQPLELIYYLIIGPAGSRNQSTECPYTGGIYQMKENMHTYWPLNLFICLVSMTTLLGATLLQTKTGPPALGQILSAIFPILIIARLLVGVYRLIMQLIRS